MKLKIIIFVLLLGNLNISNAQDVLSTNPQAPFANQNIDLLAESWVCFFPAAESVIEVEGSVVRVIVLAGDLCATITPVPPMSVTAEFQAGQISGLSEGVYTFEFYRLRDPNNFPPLPANYPLYFVSETQFEVTGALEPSSVNATSTLSILALILMLFGVSIIHFRRV